MAAPLLEWAATTTEPPAEPPEGRARVYKGGMEVVDAFCGAGGFSAGAMAAGCRVDVGSIDSAPTPLKLWAANTGGRAVCATISRDAVDWPEARPGLHVHLSPACTHLSKARAGSASQGDVDAALQTWSAGASSSWRGKGRRELVAREREHAGGRAAGRRGRRPPPERGGVHHGGRRRLWLSFQPPPPHRLDARHHQAAQGAADAPRIRGGRLCRRGAAAAGAAPALQYDHPRRLAYGSPCVRSVQQPAFCVTASHPLTWCDRNGATVRCLTVAESACLMGFPSSWKLPLGSRNGLRAVGNAVPVPLGAAIMRAALPGRLGWRWWRWRPRPSRPAQSGGRRSVRAAAHCAGWRSGWRPWSGGC